jgi:hypothetical protein
MAVAISIAALVVTIASGVIAFLAKRDASRSARAATRSAHAAEAADRRARTPQLDIVLSNPAPTPIDRVIYRVRNDGPQDLDDLIIYRPRPTDGITYPIAVTGRDFADDEIHLGPVALAQEAQFTLCCGAAAELPEFRVRIECLSGHESWTMTCLLPPPRG